MFRQSKKNLTQRHIIVIVTAEVIITEKAVMESTITMDEEDIIMAKVVIMVEDIIMEKAAIMDIEDMEANVIMAPTTREMKVRMNQTQDTIMEEKDAIITDEKVITMDEEAIIMAKVVIMVEDIIMGKAAIMDIEDTEANVIVAPTTGEMKVRMNQTQDTIMEEKDAIITDEKVITMDEEAIIMAKVVIMVEDIIMGNAAIMDTEDTEANVIMAPTTREMKVRMNQTQNTIMEEKEAIITDEKVIAMDGEAIIMAKVVIMVEDIIMGKAAIMDTEDTEANVIMAPTTREMKVRMNQTQDTIMEEKDAIITDEKVIAMDEEAIIMAKVVIMVEDIIMEKAAIMDTEDMEANVIMAPTTREMKVRMNQTQNTIMEEKDAIIMDEKVIAMDEEAIIMAKVVIMVEDIIMEKAAIMDTEDTEANVIMVPTTREMKVRMSQTQDTIMEEKDAIITDEKVITMDEEAIIMAKVVIMVEHVIMGKAAIMDTEDMEANVIMAPTTREMKVRMNQMQDTIMEEKEAIITDEKVITMDEEAIIMAKVIIMVEDIIMERATVMEDAIITEKAAITDTIKKLNILDNFSHHKFSLFVS